MADDMKLPEGNTAGDCGHFEKCKQMFGCRKNSITCDFSPSKFWLKEYTYDHDLAVRKYDTSPFFHAMVSSFRQFFRNKASPVSINDARLAIDLAQILAKKDI